jgi:5-methylcytosine-specific restriction protein A
MATRAEHTRRPWEIENKAKPQEGRLVETMFYNSRTWRKVRAEHLRREPLCQECLKKGITRLAQMVDHILPINREDAFDTRNEKWGEPYDHNNLQSLCHKCHAIKTNQDKKYYHR